MIKYYAALGKGNYTGELLINKNAERHIDPYIEVQQKRNQ